MFFLYAAAAISYRKINTINNGRKIYFQWNFCKQKSLNKFTFYV